MKTKYLKLLIFTSFFLLIPLLSFGQIVKCEISVNLERLPSVHQNELRDLEFNLTQYVNNYDWTKEKYDDKIELRIEIQATNYVKGSKNYFSADIIVSNKNDLFTRDRGWSFTSPNGKSFSNREQNFDDLLSVIDFYVYYACGSAYDGYGPLLGTSFFTKALTLSSKGTFAETPFSSGWDRRKTLVEDILSEKLKPYRQMKAIFEFGKYSYEVRQDIPRAKEVLEKCLDRMLEASSQAPNSVELTNFLNANRKFLIDFFSQFRSDVPFRKLKGIDISNREEYDQYLD